MPEKKKLTLKEAQKKNKLEQFIKQEEKELDNGDQERFDKALKSISTEKKNTTGQKKKN